MTTFHLTVVTPDGCAFDGQAERIVCRAIDGDIAIHHADKLFTNRQAEPGSLEVALHAGTDLEERIEQA